MLSGAVVWGLSEGAWGLITGTRLYASVPKTGQTTCYNQSGTVISCTNTGQDGEYQLGVAWPSPRFITGTAGVVTDTLTGLVWLENANCAGGQMTWTLAISYSNALYDGCTDCFGTSGDCGLADGSSVGDWRLPNVRELQSLIDYGESSHALPSGHPFTNPAFEYWSSTGYLPNTSNAWIVYSLNGNLDNRLKTDNYYAWPVRGGQ